MICFISHGKTILARHRLFSEQSCCVGAELVDNFLMRVAPIANRVSVS